MTRPLAPDAARLIIADSERNADLYYATRFRAPDPFAYFEHASTRAIVVSRLEIGRARRQAQVERVYSYEEYETRAKAERGHGEAEATAAPPPKRTQVLAVLLRDLGITQLSVPETFPLGAALELGELGFRVTVEPDPFFPLRQTKTPAEVDMMEAVMQRTEAALAEAIGRVAEARISGDQLIWRGTALTAEALKIFLATRLLELDCLARGTIVAVGDQGCDPHDQGSGALRPHTSVILDVFPQDLATGYHADLTRTIVRGRATEELKRIYAAVEAAQGVAFQTIRAGQEAREVHRLVEGHFAACGFETVTDPVRPEGFIHGTGHGLGLDVHEPPRLFRHPHCLQAGEVVTVEPGLYYRGRGAVRLEDVVVVQPDGCRNLTRLEKVLEV